MKKLLLPVVAALVALASPVAAEVVRPAPDFSIPGAPGKQSLKGLRGQPVVLLIGKSPKSRAVKKQLKRIQEVYRQFAARNVIFASAMANGGEIRSNIPFVPVNDPAKVTSDYGITKGFALIVIGKDGNIDLLTRKVTSGERIRDVVQNAFPVQASERQ